MIGKKEDYQLLLDLADLNVRFLKEY